MTDPINWETVNALIDATAEAREVIREAHEATKDLRREIAEAKAFIARDIRAEMEAEVEKQGRGTGRGDETEAMDAAVEKVGKEFDRLEAIFTGTDRQTRREGRPPLEELIRAKAAAGEQP